MQSGRKMASGKGIPFQGETPGPGGRAAAGRASLIFQSRPV